MKNFFKRILKKTGYVIVTEKLHRKLVDINHITSLDFHYLLKKQISSSEPLVMFDIGANVGQTALKFHAYYPNSVIYCFEPIRSTFEGLTANVNHQRNIHTYNFAFGDEVCEIEVFHRQWSELNSLVEELNELEKSRGSSSEIIAVNTIDCFLETNGISRIHILKSDTEGFELRVLSGAKNALRNKVFDYLYFEVGFVKSDKQHTYLVDMINFLEPYNYRFSGLFEMDRKENLTISYANALFVKS